MKDYYKIMEVPYDATAEDIRRAYHRLAIKYHPDKNSGSIAAASAFQALQEAYEVLSDEGRRRTFHAGSHYPLAGQKPPPVETATTICQKCKILRQKINAAGTQRVSAALISTAVGGLLSHKNIGVLQREKQAAIIEETIKTLIECMQPLPYRLVKNEAARLLLVAGNHSIARNQVFDFMARKRKMRIWEKYNLLIIGLVTLVICLLILFLSE